MFKFAALAFDPAFDNSVLQRLPISQIRENGLGVHIRQTDATPDRVYTSYDGFHAIMESVYNRHIVGMYIPAVFKAGFLSFVEICEYSAEVARVLSSASPRHSCQSSRMDRINGNNHTFLRCRRCGTEWDHQSLT